MPRANAIKDWLKHSKLAAPLTIAGMAKAGYLFTPGHWDGADDKDRAILQEIRQTGFHIIPDYYSAVQCQTLRAEIDRCIEAQKESVSFDDLIGDARIFGAEKLSDEIKAFHQDVYLQKLSDLHHGEHAPPPFTLAARLEPNKINENKDHGWHRDSLRRQFKAIIYLDDVGLENGPFQYITGSHRPGRIFADGLCGDIPYMAAAIKPESAQKIIDREPERLKTITGKAGTLILVNTSGIHRGSTILSGKRYALTNYYMYKDEVGPELNQKFGPLAFRAQ